MFQILRPDDQRKGKITAVEFEGEPYGAGISSFLGNLESGNGPGLHQHPYAETCIVLSGRAGMQVGGKEVVANAGDIIIIGPSTPHRFVAIGDKPLNMVCVHAAERFVIEPASD